MNVFINPDPADWKRLTERPVADDDFLESTVKNILARVKAGGDPALIELTREHDGVRVEDLRVTPEELQSAGKNLAPELKAAIDLAADNIRKFHTAQRVAEPVIETTEGVFCWRKQVPIERVGIYIPGGSAPLFSTVLMLGIPAVLAGCTEVVLCTPPGKNGKVNEAILYCTKQVGLTHVYKVGGAQAIAAMAYGTQTIPAVDKIFGPGNQFVTKAKQLVNAEGTAIDLPAGPSEVLVLADETADPLFVATDLLSQAEHGPDSQVMLVLTDAHLFEPIQQQLSRVLDQLPRKSIAQVALQHSRAIVLNTKKQCIDFINGYAPEHLILNTKDAEQLATEICHAGSVFIGNYTPEVMGDYATGTNHTLPTNGFSRAYSGVGLESFMKTISFQRITRSGMERLGPAAQCMAEAEQLAGHAWAVATRLGVTPVKP